MAAPRYPKKAVRASSRRLRPLGENRQNQLLRRAATPAAQLLPRMPTQRAMQMAGTSRAVVIEPSSATDGNSHLDTHGGSLVLRGPRPRNRVPFERGSFANAGRAWPTRKGQQPCDLHRLGHEEVEACVLNPANLACACERSKPQRWPESMRKVTPSAATSEECDPLAALESIRAGDEPPKWP